MKYALEVFSLRFAYDSAAVLSDISFQIAANESVGLAGANGSGKSTLLWCIVGLLRASGKVLLFGDPPGRKRLAHLGMVFQNPEDQLFMPTLAQDLAIPLINSGIDREVAYERAARWLGEFGLADYRERPATHLSLGQRKRAALALALIRQPEFLLLDEPTAELDGRAARQFSEMLLGIGVAKLIASHDLRFLRATTTRTMILSKGQIIADGATEELLDDENLLYRAGLI